MKSLTGVVLFSAGFLFSAASFASVTFNNISAGTFVGSGALSSVGSVKTTKIVTLPAATNIAAGTVVGSIGPNSTCKVQHASLTGKSSGTVKIVNGSVYQQQLCDQLAGDKAVPGICCGFNNFKNGTGPF